MNSQKNVFGLVEFGRRKNRNAVAGLKPFEQTTTDNTDEIPTAPRGRPQHLVGLLFAHGSRARRASMPKVGIRLSVFTPTGKAAVKIRV